MCLLDQRYLLDDALTVRQLLQQQGAGKQGGGGVGGGALEVTGFLRVQVGEGLEAAEGAKDFAAEVAEMAGGRS
jgi:translation elongation factor EF-Ts